MYKMGVLRYNVLGKSKKNLLFNPFRVENWFRRYFLPRVPPDVRRPGLFTFNPIGICVTIVHSLRQLSILNILSPTLIKFNPDTHSTYTQTLYQIVFSTKERQPVLHTENRPQLFKYIYGILKNKNCHLYRINGVEDHLHILTSLHPSIALSSLVKDIKIASSLHIKENHLFPDYTNWQEGYGAFTYSVRDLDNLIEYVKNQVEHYKKITFRDEFIAMLKEHNIVFDEKYLL